MKSAQDEALQKGKKRKEKNEHLTPTKNTNIAELDYAVYIMTKREKIVYTLLAAALLFAIGYVFYRSIIVSCLFALLAFKYPKIRAAQIALKRQKDLRMQFKDMLYSLSSAVGAGSSVEHGLAIALTDMKKQYSDPKTSIVQELELMVSRVNLGQNVEEVFNDFARRSHIEDVQTFANIFEVSKRTGGNLIRIIRQTTDVISEKTDVKNEIDTALAGRKMEQKVLTLMPIALVLFMSETTDGFMDPVFSTIGGRVVATVSLLFILSGYLWSKKITDIEV